MIQTLVHYSMHLIVPAFFAMLLNRERWKYIYLIFLLTMLVDFDHLLANPIFEPGRCSINFHPLHTFWAMGVYLVGLLFKPTRIIALGLLWHMITDATDCWMHSL